MQPRLPTSDQMPEIRKYKKRFNSEINCASLWGVNLLIGTNNGLLLLDRSGQVSPPKPGINGQKTIIRFQGQAYPLITNRKFQQIDVLENLNLVLSISGKKNKLRVYYLSWLKSKIDPKFSERNSKRHPLIHSGSVSFHHDSLPLQLVPSRFTRLDFIFHFRHCAPIHYG